jgi:hypothetical protein
MSASQVRAAARDQWRTDPVLTLRRVSAGNDNGRSAPGPSGVRVADECDG